MKLNELKENKDYSTKVLFKCAKDAGIRLTSYKSLWMREKAGMIKPRRNPATNRRLFTKKEITEIIVNERVIKNDTGFHHCPACGYIMREMWENVGFTPPQGPSKMEIRGYKCPNCDKEES